MAKPRHQSGRHKAGDGEQHPGAFEVLVQVLVCPGSESERRKKQPAAEANAPQWSGGHRSVGITKKARAVAKYIYIYIYRSFRRVLSEEGKEQRHKGRGQSVARRDDASNHALSGI